MAWLERRSHGEVDAIDTPIGYLPKYEDLKSLFKSRIDKEYPEDLYVKQFSLYIDNIVGPDWICRLKPTAKKRTFRPNCSIF